MANYQKAPKSVGSDRQQSSAHWYQPRFAAGFWVTGEVLMRLPLLAMTWVVCVTGAAVAQPSNGNSIPCEIGNRANGFDYQPTPREIYPRERSAGVLPSKVSEVQTDRTLEELDRSLMLSEGLSTESVPVFAPRW